MGIVGRSGAVSVRGEPMLRRRLVVSSVFVVCMSVAAPIVSAEWFMDLYLGPALFISDVEVDLQPESGSDTSLDIGLDARAGLGWRFDRNIGIFVEYRFT